MRIVTARQQRVVVVVVVLDGVTGGPPMRGDGLGGLVCAMAVTERGAGERVGGGSELGEGNS